jgi:hypothetical protein
MAAVARSRERGDTVLADVSALRAMNFRGRLKKSGFSQVSVRTRELGNEDSEIP